MLSSDATRCAGIAATVEAARWLSLKPSRLRTFLFDCRTDLSSGGAAARAHGLPPYPDFAFPQQLNPQIVAPGWRPRFIDYLYLGFTNATALSPTDAMPLAAWAKIAMTVQSLISLALLAFVIARAVDVLS